MQGGRVLYQKQVSRLRANDSLNLSGRYVYGTGLPVPGFYELRGGLAFLSAQRNQLRLPDYQRADLRINKAFVRDRYQLTLFAEVVNLTNRGNTRFDDVNNFDPRTGRVSLSFEKLFPILPSVGIAIDF